MIHLCKSTQAFFIYGINLQPSRRLPWLLAQSRAKQKQGKWTTHIQILYEWVHYKHNTMRTMNEWTGQSRSRSQWDAVPLCLSSQLSALSTPVRSVCHAFLTLIRQFTILSCNSSVRCNDKFMTSTRVADAWNTLPVSIGCRHQLSLWNVGIGEAAFHSCLCAKRVINNWFYKFNL